jgi:hypothetical protein
LLHGAPFRIVALQPQLDTPAYYGFDAHDLSLTSKSRV